MTAQEKRTETLLRMLIAHWDEFGPTYGFSEKIDIARKHLRSLERVEATHD